MARTAQAAVYEAPNGAVHPQVLSAAGCAVSGEVLVRVSPMISWTRMPGHGLGLRPSQEWMSDRQVLATVAAPFGSRHAAQQRPLRARRAVNPRVRVNFDAQLLASRLMTMRGIHNYRPRHRIQALEFVMANRGRFLFKPIVDAKFPLREVGVAFKKASERAVMGAAIMP